jgi:hypothetical protein
VEDKAAALARLKEARKLRRALVPVRPDARTIMPFDPDHGLEYG